MADRFIKDVAAKIIAAMETDLPWNGRAVPIDVRFAVECLLAAGWDFVPPVRAQQDRERMMVRCPKCGGYFPDDELEHHELCCGGGA